MANRYYIPATEEVINSYWILKRKFPNYSLQQNVDIPELGVYLINPTPQPEYDPETQYLTQSMPEQREDGKWYEVWEVVDIPQETQE